MDSVKPERSQSAPHGDDVVPVGDQRWLGVDAASQLAAAGHAVVTTASEGMVLAWNPAAAAMYGWTATEAIGEPVRNLYLAGVPAGVLDHVQHPRNARWSGGLLVRRKDGSTFPALLTCTPVHQDGRLVGTVTVSVNIGPAARVLLDRSTDAALVVCSDGTIGYASPAVRQVLGWEVRALLGSDVHDLLHPGDAETLAAFLHDAATLPGAHPPVLLRLRGPNGWLAVEAAITNLFDDPTVCGVICNIRSNPHRDALDAAERTAAQLQTALETRVVIEQAKGYLVARRGLALDEAFTQLRQYARSQRKHLHDVARDVVTGKTTLP